MVEDAEDLDPDLVDIIKGRLRDLMEMVSKVLTLRKFEEGKITTQMSTFSVSNELLRVLEIKGERLQKKRIFARTKFETEEMFVWADRQLLRQVLANLISNAIKYSPFDKELLIRCSTGATNKTIRIEIVDQGPGIKPEDQDKLFQQFQRLSSVPTDGESSMGVGLSIVKLYTEAMHGKVWCESVFGQGSTFIVELPIGSSS
jgi:signal transduction histidine kinase